MTRESDDRAPERQAVDASYPFTGRWLVQNSPANRVPSHGTALYATAYAIDFVPIAEAGGSASITIRALFAPEAPERFPGFGRPILAPVGGRVVTVRDDAPDHRAFRGLPSLWYAMTQRSRITAGWAALAGNHLMIEAGTGVVVALCHLRQGSIRVQPGDGVAMGDPLAECGNSGNSTEPHLHVQAMSDTDPTSARALPMSFNRALPRSGSIVGSPDGAL